MTCKHWTATDKDCWYIDSGGCHQKSRYVLITVWNHNKGIKLMCHSHTFCRVCNQISCYKRIFHPCMSHCNTITNRDCREYDWCTACHCNTNANCFYDFVDVHMSRYNFIVGADNPNQRFRKFFFCQPKCIK